jgi:hypothetical protein
MAGMTTALCSLVRRQDAVVCCRALTGKLKYISTYRMITFTAKDGSSGSVSGFHSQSAGFESRRPILSGIFHGLPHSVQTNSAQQM